MRFVDASKGASLLPAGWSTKSANGLKAVSGESDPAKRAALIDARRLIWSSAKPTLTKLAGKKCWYCETPAVRMHLAVDHFRPKGRVEGVELHPGYWWLAFEFSNYRLACQYCNSPVTEGGATFGKGTKFPLVTETDRVLAPGVLDAEKPIFLDPTVETDPDLLTFDDDGVVHPKSSADAVDRNRATVSIRVFGLNSGSLPDARRDTRRRIEVAADELVSAVRGLVAGTLAADEVVKCMETLQALISVRAAYSAMAVTTLRGLRHNPEIDALLQSEGLLVGA